MLNRAYGLPPSGLCLIFNGLHRTWCGRMIAGLRLQRAVIGEFVIGVLVYRGVPGYRAVSIPYRGSAIGLMVIGLLAIGLMSCSQNFGGSHVRIPKVGRVWTRATRAVAAPMLPSSQTTAIVTPALKKPSLDSSDMKNYRPISNLSFMSKVVERIVVRQLLEYFTANSLLPKFQSGFRRHHSTESALLWVLSDIFSATDKGEVSLLALLNVSAAFDTVDHSILLNRLSISYGISGSAFDWMQSFVVGRTQTVHYDGAQACSAAIWNYPGISTGPNPVRLVHSRCP